MEDRGRGRGRGSAILEMLKRAQEAAEPGTVDRPPDSSPSVHQEQAAAVSAPPSQPTGGRGRAGLLQFVQKLAQPILPTPGQQESSASSPAPSLTPRSSSIASPPPQPAQQSFGRASSLLSLARTLSSPGDSRSVSSSATEPSALPTSQDSSGVLGSLSALSIEQNSTVSSVAPPISRQGTSGKPVNITANYIDLTIETGKGIFRYEVKFAPEVDAAYLRRKLLNQHSATIGTARTFDGVTLYLPIMLPEPRTTFQSIHPVDNSNVQVTIIFQKKQNMADSIAFFNVLLGRVMRSLDLVRIGRDNYNPRCPHPVPQHRLELWPGYVTAIDEYEGGLKLNINSSHRVIRTDTIRDYMGEIFRNNRANGREAVKAEIIGLTVLTRYNNRVYRIDDVEWDKNPKFTFEKNKEQISIYDYYKTHWNIEIKDMDQPLLTHRYKQKTPSGETIEATSLLVPELCYLSGLTDKLRSDFRVMKDLATVTQVGPEARRKVILSFVKDVKSKPAAMEVLSGWGLQLAEDTVNLKGRCLEPELITFGNGRTFSSEKADWSGPAVSSPMLRTPHMRNWCILSTEKDARICADFVKMLRSVSNKMSMDVSEPRVIQLKSDRTDNYLSEIRKVMSPQLQMVVAICPTNRNDRYAAIKKLCCVDMPIKSQVIVTRTISRSDKLKSVSEKIALQLNCKLGGALWALKIPFDNCMICGVDVYHAAMGEKSRGSVAAFVASLDKPLTSWYSRISFQHTNQELIDALKICLISSIHAYAKRIILYRDGVGDGQLDTVAAYEVKQLQSAFSTVDESYKPKLTVIIVQKRINTRLIEVRGRLQNPQPGTVVDTMVTRRNYFDFYLVPQTSRQGTVSPTHYVVVHDDAEMKTDHLQRLSFKLCHLYYNWPGTVKVPAPCQYAHKLAYLVGQSIGQEPSEVLADSLYYL